MTLWTLAKYLIGDRKAILRVARSPQTLWVGLMFVVAAGFAREYDGEDLLREPWHLAIPLAASVGSSAILYLLVRLVAYFRGCREPGLVHGYRDFLAHYWMTAPLALLYAIPVERFLSAPASVAANLSFLAIVAAWRVALMARVVSVIYRAPLWESALVVLFFGDTLVAVVLAVTPLPIVGIMGGIRLSEAEQVLHNVGLMLTFWSVMTWPLWFIGLWIAAELPVLWPRASRRERWQYVPVEPSVVRTISQPLLILGVATIAMWAFILPFTQPEQQLRVNAERLLQSGQIREGLELMSAHEPADFPPHWDPPPRLAYRESKPDIEEVYHHIALLEVKPWVTQVFTDKLSNSFYGEGDHEWWSMSEEELDRRVTLIESMPDRINVTRDHAETLRWISEDKREMDRDLRERITKLLSEAEVLQE
jgi:hypothetical protein